MAKRSDLWSGVAQNLLVALIVFLFAQLWTRKEKIDSVRDGLFDVKSEVTHNGVLISDASTNLQQIPSLEIRSGHTLVEGLETQSIQRNLPLLAQQNETYSNELVKYYADIDALKRSGQDELATLDSLDRQIQDYDTRVRAMLVRRDTFLVNEDRIQSRHPTLLADTERNIAVSSRDLQIMQNNLLKTRDSEKKMLLMRLKMAANEQALALATISVIYADLDIRELRAYRWIAYLFVGFIFSAFIPMIVRDRKKWLNSREPVSKADEESAETE